MATKPESKLGPLRSENKLKLHTKYAVKLWNGRRLERDANGKVTQSSILSVPNCLGILTKIYQDAGNDNPYADDYLIQFEDKVLTYRQEMRQLTEKLIKLYVDRIPENFEFENCSNISPVSYEIFVSTPLGFQLIYLLGDFDALARAALTAAHFAVLTNAESRDWEEAGARMLRQCFGVIENYRNSEITRKDARENNARYQAAVKKMGYTLSEHVLNGARRANFAPFIKEQGRDELDSPMDSQE